MPATTKDEVVIHEVDLSKQNFWRANMGDFQSSGMNVLLRIARVNYFFFKAPLHGVEKKLVEDRFLEVLT